ncbi:hypothetical protein K1X13_15020 [Nocardioides sp. WL0053]|uniref:Universal stress protein n=1 Tax=Nocardioides jiangsuensis TaxID=2866161 RepID=A0ABS7RMD2_9ACTN|nr:hypothetical protein [Nocardioides jiangsuensis]MBY9076146.1 hypothetical protein [Nocardioides jiangsuensis]
MTESTYDVVLLIEQPLSGQDARQVRGLHEDFEEHVRYHVLLPVEDAAARVESAMGSLAASEVLASPALVMDEADLENVQHELLENARRDLSACLGRLSELGADAVGEIVSIDPIDALAAKVAQVDGREAIILTRPHVVSEFFHMDWTSRARRKIGVPVLHLLERETFDEQAGGGEGVTGM